MNRQLLKDSLGWGFILWLIGYALGIVLFPLSSTIMLGWLIMPIGTAITLGVLIKKIKSRSFSYYLLIALIWTSMAVVLDYFFLVKMFKPLDYYKLDVYLYYILTFILPLIIGGVKASRRKLS